MSRPLSVLLLLALVVGCGTRAPRTSTEVATSAREDWFCVDAGDGTHWRCARGAPPSDVVREPVLAMEPRPAGSAESVAPPPAAAVTPPRPPEPTPLWELPRDFFTVQLAAFASEAELDGVASELGLERPLTARIERDGTIYWVLLLGIYPDRDEAERAAESRPDELERFTPWVRSVGSLQDAMARAGGMAQEGTPH
jgi:septal ring-binding cell division protein DamX